MEEVKNTILGYHRVFVYSLNGYVVNCETDSQLMYLAAAYTTYGNDSWWPTSYIHYQDSYFELHLGAYDKSVLPDRGKVIANFHQRKILIIPNKFKNPDAWYWATEVPL